MRAPPAAHLGDLEAFFRGLFYTPEATTTTPAIPDAPLDPPVTGDELQRVLRGRYRGSASAGLCPLPSQCIRHLPAALMAPLAAWFQTLSARGEVPRS